MSRFVNRGTGPDYGCDDPDTNTGSSRNQREISSTETLSDTDQDVVLNSDAGAFTVTLPALMSVPLGRRVAFYNVGPNRVTVVANPADGPAIDGDQDDWRVEDTGRCEFVVVQKGVAKQWAFRDLGAGIRTNAQINLTPFVVAFNAGRLAVGDLDAAGFPGAVQGQMILPGTNGQNIRLGTNAANGLFDDWTIRVLDAAFTGTAGQHTLEILFASANALDEAAVLIIGQANNRAHLQLHDGTLSLNTALETYPYTPQSTVAIEIRNAGAGANDRLWGVTKTGLQMLAASTRGGALPIPANSIDSLLVVDETGAALGSIPII